MSTENSGTQVVIMTLSYQIRGRIDLLPGSRITDFVNEAKEFIAVTEAEVRSLDGRMIFSTPFIDVRNDHIELITHAELATRA